MTQAKTHLVAIDAIRLTCALLVVAHHYATLFPLGTTSFLRSSAPDVTLGGGDAWWSWAGWVGVEIFFVISGYVIAASGARGTGRAFLARRALRLAPAAWACATITALVVLAAGAASFGDIAPRWLASVAFSPVGPLIDGAYWTLGIEVMFYALVAILLDDRGNNPRTIERLGLALALASAGYWALRTGGVLGATDNRAVDLLLLTYGGCFASGIALWAIRSDGVTRLRIAILAIGLAATSCEIVAEATRTAYGLGLYAGPALPLALFALGVGGIVLAERLQRALLWLARPHIWGFAGLLTYPLYLLHQHIGAVVITAAHRVGATDHAAMLAALGVSIALASLVVLTIEPRLRSALVRVSRPRAPAPDTPRSASLPTG